MIKIFISWYLIMVLTAGSYMIGVNYKAPKTDNIKFKNGLICALTAPYCLPALIGAVHGLQVSKTK